MSNIKDLADPNVDRVLIYAGDGGCYWRQNGCGYTYAHTAGVFTRAEAYSLAGHCGPEKRIELHPVPDDHVPTLQAENTALKEELTGWRHEREMTLAAFRHVATGGDPALVGHPHGSEFGDALREMLVSREAALRTAAAEWQALAEDLRSSIGTFLADITNCHPDYCDHGRDNPGICLRNLRDQDYLELQGLLYPTPADSLAAHDREVRAKALREAEGKLIEKAPGIPDAYDEQGVGKNAAYDECIEILQSMASAAEKETTNAR